MLKTQLFSYDNSVQQCNLFTYKLIIPSFEILIVWIASSISSSCYWYTGSMDGRVSVCYNIQSGDELQILCVISQPSPAQVLYRCRRLQWIIWSSNTLYEHTIAISGSGRAWCVCVLLIGTQQHACKQWWALDTLLIDRHLLLFTTSPCRKHILAL